MKDNKILKRSNNKREVMISIHNCAEQNFSWGDGAGKVNSAHFSCPLCMRTLAPNCWEHNQWEVLMKGNKRKNIASPFFNIQKCPFSGAENSPGLLHFHEYETADLISSLSKKISEGSHKNGPLYFFYKLRGGFFFLTKHSITILFKMSSK